MVSVCLFFCLCPIDVKTAEVTDPLFFVGPAQMTPGKVYECSELKISLPTKFIFKIFENQRKILLNSQTLFVIVLYSVEREDAHK